MTVQQTLDLAWDHINALGGYIRPRDDYGLGFNEALEEALSLLEGMGANKHKRFPLEDLP